MKISEILIKGIKELQGQPKRPDDSNMPPGTAFINEMSSRNTPQVSLETIDKLGVSPKIRVIPL